MRSTLFSGLALALTLTISVTALAHFRGDSEEAERPFAVVLAAQQAELQRQVVRQQLAANFLKLGDHRINWNNVDYITRRGDDGALVFVGGREKPLVVSNGARELFSLIDGIETPEVRSEFPLDESNLDANEPPSSP